ncbi:MAG: DUF3164 family protein [Cohaesibacter sp.]|jgi:hypothetical protein|nr:DUF3164 family protein [Cohaesibacter sp.]
MTDQVKVPEGFMMNSKGDFVHIDNIKAQHKLEDELVKKIHAKAQPINNSLAEFRAGAIEEIDEFVDLLVAEYGGKKRGGKKGNVTLTTFDGSQRVELVVSETLGFGAELLAAKELIEECLREWGETSHPNLRTIIEQAFRLNRKGELSVSNVMTLHQYDFDDPRWLQAMSAINDATRINSSKRYVRVLKRRGEADSYVTVPLDAANAEKPQDEPQSK